MTELQWLIKMLTTHKLPNALKDLFIERIGEVEATLSSKQIRMQTNPMNPMAPQQAPSTQRLLDQQAIVPQPPPRIELPKEIITSSGNGTSTRGPRKF